MAYRELLDAAGRRWRIWDTDPHEFAGRPLIAADYSAGWLTFESDREKRRLLPAPPGWERLRAEELTALLDRAAVVSA